MTMTISDIPAPTSLKVIVKSLVEKLGKSLEDVLDVIEAAPTESGRRFYVLFHDSTYMLFDAKLPPGYH